MLSVFYGAMPEAIDNPPMFFKNTFRDEWITDELSREMIQDVDRSTVITAHLIESPVLGGISPRELSGGVKTLILIHRRPELVFNASACGDNCAKWLLKIGEMQDVLINLRHLMYFGEGPFNIHIKNTDQYAHSERELLSIAGRITG